MSTCDILERAKRKPDSRKHQGKNFLLTSKFNSKGNFLEIQPHKSGNTEQQEYE